MNDIQKLQLGIGIFLFVLLAVNVLNAWLTDRDSKKFEHWEAIDKLTNKGGETKSLSCEKIAIFKRLRIIIKLKTK